MTDGRTDRRTDGQNYDLQDRASIAALRGKNGGGKFSVKVFSVFLFTNHTLSGLRMPITVLFPALTRFIEGRHSKYLTAMIAIESLVNRSLFCVDAVGGAQVVRQSTHLPGCFQSPLLCVAPAC